MLLPRVVPSLLIHNGGLVKTVRFKKPSYVGDPIVAVKIFNEKEVDEIAILDISASIEHRRPNFERIREIASEAFIPLSYGGGIRSIEDAERLFTLGIEKVILNTAAAEIPQLISQITRNFGSQAVVVSIDVKKISGFFSGTKHEVHIRSGKKNLKVDPILYAKRAEELGAGEIMLTSIDNEGTMQGYDLDLIRSVAEVVSIPVMASGGAGSLSHICQAIFDAKASAAAAGSLFIYHGKHRAVLINYPERSEIEEAFCKVSAR